MAQGRAQKGRRTQPGIVSIRKPPPPPSAAATPMLRRNKRRQSRNKQSDPRRSSLAGCPASGFSAVVCTHPMAHSPPPSTTAATQGRRLSLRYARKHRDTCMHMGLRATAHRSPRSPVQPSTAPATTAAGRPRSWPRSWPRPPARCTRARPRRPPPAALSASGSAGRRRRRRRRLRRRHRWPVPVPKLPPAPAQPAARIWSRGLPRLPGPR